MEEKKPSVRQAKPSYIDSISPATVDRIYAGLMQEIAVKQRYLDPDLTAADLTRELRTNTRALSAVMQLRFDGNFKTVVNRFRVDRAMSMMKDKRYNSLTCEEIGLSCGFQNRQSFYNAFGRMVGQTPASYRKNINTGKNIRQ